MMIERVFIYSLDMNLEENLFLVVDFFFPVRCRSETLKFIYIYIYMFVNIKILWKAFKTLWCYFFTTEGSLPVGAALQNLT